MISQQTSSQSQSNRRGASALDYVLVLGVVFPLGVLVIPTGLKMVRAAYEMMCVWVAWPFL